MIRRHLIIVWLCFWGLSAGQTAPLDEATRLNERPQKGATACESGLANFNHALAHQRNGEPGKAELILLQLLAHYEEKHTLDDPLMSDTLSALAEIYRTQGQPANAEPLYSRVATTLGNLAGQYVLAGEYDKAESCYLRIVEIYEKTPAGQRLDLVPTLLNLALLYRRAGAYAKCLSLYQRVYQISVNQLGEDHAELAPTLNNLAWAYDATGQYVKAETHYRQALAINERTLPPTNPEVARSLVALGQIYVRVNELGKAEPLFQRALAIYRAALPGSADLAATLNSLASVRLLTGQYRQAIPFYEEALALYQKASGPEQQLSIGHIFNNLGALYASLNEPAKAESYYQKALEIHRKTLPKEHPNLATVLNNLGLQYILAGAYDKAEPLHKEALAIREKLGAEHPEVAQSLNNLAWLYQNAGQPTLALKMRARAAEIEESNIRNSLAVGSEQRKQRFLNLWAGRVSLEISLHTRSLPNNVEAAQLALTSILRRKGRALDAMTAQIGALRRRAKPSDAALLDQLTDVRTRLANLNVGLATDLAERRAQTARLEEEAEKLEDQISRSIPEFQAQTQPVTLERVQQAIPPRAALVELFAYQPSLVQSKEFGVTSYIAYILLRTGRPRFAELGPAASIDASAARFRAALLTPNSLNAKEAARELDELVMRPVRRHLGDTQHLLLSPDGVLNLVPFSALVAENGKYLLETYSLTYLTSGRDLLRAQVAPARANAQAPLVVANPLFDMKTPHTAPRTPTETARETELARDFDFTALNYKPLPGTDAEARELRRLFPDASVLSGEQATEAALKGVRQPRLLHIATHGFFLDRPPEGRLSPRDGFGVAVLQEASVVEENPLLRSGLILAGAKQKNSGAHQDGVLTALELAGLDLWGTKLVVLSACETGLGRVENGAGVYGLRRALVLAGSETQVMSLWKVSDGGTKDLMAAYYTNLLAAAGRTEALRQVQLAMLQGRLLPALAPPAAKPQRNADTRELGDAPAKDYRHPYYWASFIASGDWRNLAGQETAPDAR